jgi:DNA-binding response OmpR family regulator
MRRLGYAVEVAISGREAVAKVGATRYGLVILELVLPDMRGEEVMRHISAMDAQLPIVVFTEHPSYDSAMAALAARVDDYLIKPVAADEIAQTISRVLARRVTC